MESNEDVIYAIVGIERESNAMGIVAINIGSPNSELYPLVTTNVSFMELAREQLNKPEFRKAIEEKWSSPRIVTFKGIRSDALWLS